MSTIGFQDKPHDPQIPGSLDLLGLNEYSEAISEFILNCPTPMTIGIQGDWGSGKTSLMNMICNYINENSTAPLKCIWFNTWQYTQFDYGDKLPITMLSNLSEKITSEKNKVEKGWLSRKLGQAAEGAKLITESLAATAISKGSAGMINGEKVVDGFVRKDDKDPSLVLEELKSGFEDLCTKYFGENVNGKIVVFIDDLDRLLPERAVELMEVLKNFLDVPSVVFVLACDYQVVEKGLGKKFGVKPEELDGRSFFDKIIQVPFRMPVANYTIQKFVEDKLAAIGWKFSEADLDQEKRKPEELDCTYQNILATSIGFNPRTIKRHFNTLLLLKLVLLKSKDEDKKQIVALPEKAKLLFATVCLEAAYPSFFKHMRKRLAKCDLEVLYLLNNENEQLSLMLEKENGTFFKKENKQNESFLEFAKIYFSIVDRSGEGNIDDDELKILSAILDVSGLTSVEGTANKEGEDIVSSGAQYFIEYITNDGEPILAEIAKMILQSAEVVGQKRSRGYENRIRIEGIHWEYYLDYYAHKLCLFTHWHRGDVEELMKRGTYPGVKIGLRKGKFGIKIASTENPDEIEGAKAALMAFLEAVDDDEEE